MAYRLGIDLGTTYTAAAIIDDEGRAEIFQLGDRSAAIPTVVLLREDGEVLIGDAASRRAVTEPQRVAREFKRRVGDTTPLFLGGAPHSAESLMAKVLAWVVAQVEARQGTPPERVTITRPANWGAYKIDLLEQAARMAEIRDPMLVTEPEAAALHYATVERVEPGEIVAVYDLGGGTFDATVLRRTEGGFEILGSPEGIERLGGIDVDAAVLAHVQRSLGGTLDELDEDDPATLGGLARLRAECQEAKEALSADTDAVVPVLLPNVATDVRITRDELEQMIRPSLNESVSAMRRALRNADVEPEQLSRVLLVGGSSRIPLVAEMVTSELGRPVAIDAHPKHAVALGAALAAGGTAATTASEREDSGPTITSGVLAAGAAGAAAGAAAAEAARADAAAAEVPDAADAGAGAPPDEPAEPPPTEAVVEVAPAAPASPPPVAPPSGDDGSGGGSGGGGGRKVGLIVAIVVVVVVIAVVAALALGGGDDGGDVATEESTTTSTEATTTTTEATTTTTSPDSTPAACVGATGDFICITDVAWDADTLVATYETDLELSVDTVDGELPVDSHHAHFFFDSVPLSQAGAPGDGTAWVIWDSKPYFDYYSRADIPADATAICVLVANWDHTVESNTGNCMPLPG